VRSGKKYLNNTEAAHIAEALQVNPLVIIADAETERAKDEKSRLYWASAAKKFAGIAASVLLVFTLMGLDPSPAYSATENESVYIMSNIFLQRRSIPVLYSKLSLICLLALF